MQDGNEEEAGFPLNNQVSSVSWEASEYLHHDKDYVWLVLMVAVTVFLSALSYFLLRDIFSVIVIVLMAIALGIYAYRKPRTLSYQVDEEGIYISGKFYSYNQFKSFSIVDEGAIRSIYFEPLKRFLPAMALYYDQQNEEQIKNILSSNLPYRKKELDFVEKLFRKFHY